MKVFLNAQVKRRRDVASLVFLITAIGAGLCFAADKNELLVIVQDSKYGFIDHAGKITIRPQFIWAEDFWRGLGTVYVCGRYASIDTLGTLTPLRIAVEGQLAPRKRGEKYGFVDAYGHFRIAPTFDEVLPFSEGLAAVRIRDKWGFVDTAGREVIHPHFESAFYFREGLAVVESNSGYALIDASGKVIGEGFQFFDLIADGRIPALRDKKWGYLDLQGKVTIPFGYDGANAFSGGLAAVEKEGKWGYTDRDGQLVIPFKFDEAGPFASGLAPARIGNTSGFVDKSGQFVIHLAFRQAPGFLTGDETGLFIAESDVSRFWTDDDKFGYVNTSGHVIWGPVMGSPDHEPLLGWSEEDKRESCEGVPESTRNAIAGFPEP